MLLVERLGGGLLLLPGDVLHAQGHEPKLLRLRGERFGVGWGQSSAAVGVGIEGIRTGGEGRISERVSW